MRNVPMGRVMAGVVLVLAAAAAGDYPKSVTKKLYADDIRGKPAPKFMVEKWLTDEPSRKKKVVLIDFWATWCPPCRATIPELNEFAEKFKDDLVVIGVSDENPEVVSDFMKGTSMKYAVAVDTKNRMNEAIHVAGIPHVLVISTDGVVRWQGFPLSEEEKLTAEIIKQIIDADPGLKKQKKE